MEGMQANPAQLKKFLKQLGKSREQYLSYLGQLTYQEYREGNLSLAKLQEVCATLDGIAAQISKCEQDLAAIEQMKLVAKYPRCAYCGNPIPPGSPHCPTCGQPAVPPAPTPAYPPAQGYAPAYPPAQGYAPATGAAAAAPAGGAVCAYCGAPLQVDAAFCTGCGKPVPPAPPAPAAAAPVEEAPAPEPPAAAPASLSCPACGAASDDPEALFCTECGSKMS